jgi:hypothetical protein
MVQQVCWRTQAITFTIVSALHDGCHTNRLIAPAWRAARIGAFVIDGYAGEGQITVDAVPSGRHLLLFAGAGCGRPLKGDAEEDLGE